MRTCGQTALRGRKPTFRMAYPKGGSSGYHWRVPRDADDVHEGQPRRADEPRAGTPAPTPPSMYGVGGGVGHWSRGQSSDSDGELHL